MEERGSIPRGGANVERSLRGKATRFENERGSHRCKFRWNDHNALHACNASMTFHRLVLSALGHEHSGHAVAFLAMEQSSILWCPTDALVT